MATIDPQPRKQSSKQTNTPMYINVKLDYTPTIIKHIHQSIAHRQATNSSDANIFNKTSIENEAALKSSEIFNKLTYIENNYKK